MDLPKIKPIYLYASIGLLVFISLFYVVCDRPRLSERAAKWEGEYYALKNIDIANEKILKDELAASNKTIDELNGQVTSLNGIIENDKVELADAHGAVAEARKGWENFSLECQAKLKELDTAWSLKLTIAERTIADLEERDKKRVLTIDEITKQRDLLNKGYIDRGELITKAEQGLGIKDKQIASLKRMGKLKNLALVAVIGGATYLALKK